MTIDVRSVASSALHRARLVARHEGVAWSSLAEARDLEHARRALPVVDGGLLLLTGGAAVDDRHALAAWARLVRQRTRAVLLFGRAAEAMARAIGVHDDGPMIVRCADALDASVTAARMAADGDTILLCPGRPPERGTLDPAPIFARVARRPAEALAAAAAVEAA